MKQIDAVAEFEGLDLGDARRSARARQIVGALQASPAAAFPRALGSVAEREAFYRLINNDAVSLASLLAPHRAQTIGRMREQLERPVIAIDKTKFVFEGEADREGLERISPNKQGFDALFALALSPSRRTHGVVGAELSHSGRATGSWEAFIASIALDTEAANLKPIYVMDREADVYQLFCSLVEHQRDFVIRVSWDRMARELGSDLKEPMRRLVNRAATTLKRTVRLNRRANGSRTTGQKQKYPARTVRDAELSIRACPVVLARPADKKTAALPNELTLQLVQVIEQNPPAGATPVEWMLMTSLPVNDAASVEAIVDAYRSRWRIEEYFKALKTGCNYEQRQLESRDALLNALGLLVPIAWRLLELRTLADDQPSAPASAVLEVDELHVLRKLSKDVKLGLAPTIDEAMLAIASVGGHIRQNGRPGWQVLHRGFDEVLRVVEGYRLARAEM